MLRNMSGFFIMKGTKILMLYRIGSRALDKNIWVGIGGHFEENELNDPMKCALRELEEETGLNKNDLTDIKLKYIAIRNKKNEIRLNYFFFAELAKDDIIEVQCNEGICEWVEVADVFSKEMPVTVYACLEHYFSKGHLDDIVYAGVATNSNDKGKLIITPLLDYNNN
jgi:8-oxo-dGTP diphosphatase